MTTLFRFARPLGLVLLLTLPVAALAQTGGVGIGTTAPAASAALEVRSTSQGLLLPRLTLAQRDALTASPTAPPVPGLVIYQTDGTPGLYAYDGTAWVRLGADNLGNHTATQTLDLNAQRLLGSTSTSLGDSIAQVELTASVGTQSTALITRSNFGARYTRAMLSGYGKLPDGGTTPNDYGIWATAYRSGGWAGFFSTGSNVRTPFRFVGICQNPGYNNTGSAIRIVDGTQGAGKVLTSDAIGYGTWQAPASGSDNLGNHTATQNLNLGTYQLVGNGGNAGLTVSSTGNVGIGTPAPAGGLHVTTGNGGLGGSTTSTANAGAVLSGAVGQPPHLELRGSSLVTTTNTTPYIDFAENNTVDFTTRLRSISGVLNVEGGGSGGLLFKVNGNVQATNVTFTSDARFKTDVRPLSSALASVLALRGVRYEWNALGVQHGGTAGAPQVGLIAQEVEAIYPELVGTDAEGYKAVNYAQLTPVLIEAIKELKAENDALKAQVATQAGDHADLQTLKEQLRQLQEAVAPSGQARR